MEEHLVPIGATGIQMVREEGVRMYPLVDEQLGGQELRRLHLHSEEDEDGEPPPPVRRLCLSDVPSASGTMASEDEEAEGDSEVQQEEEEFRDEEEREEDEAVQREAKSMWVRGCP